MNKKVLAMALILAVLLSLGASGLAAEKVPSSKKTVIVASAGPTHNPTGPGDPISAQESFEAIQKLTGSGKSADSFYNGGGSVDDKALVHSVARSVNGVAANALKAGINIGVVPGANAGMKLMVKVGIANAQGTFTWYTVNVTVDGDGNIIVPFTDAMVEQAAAGNGSVMFHVWKNK